MDGDGESALTANVTISLFNPNILRIGTCVFNKLRTSTNSSSHIIALLHRITSRSMRPTNTTRFMLSRSCAYYRLECVIGN